MRNQINAKQASELKRARRKNKNKSIEKRLYALILHAQGKSRKEVSSRTGYSATYISELVSKYLKNGLSAIIENHYKGNHRNLTFEEETALLEPFKTAASAGQMVEISAIKRAYEERIGRSLDKDHGLIYRLLERHGWRKVMPRSKHPNKASDEVIETSKKLTTLSRVKWKILQVEESV